MRGERGHCECWWFGNESTCRERTVTEGDVGVRGMGFLCGFSGWERLG